MVLMKEFVLSLNQKTRRHWFSYFQIAPLVQTSYMTNPLNNMFVDVGI